MLRLLLVILVAGATLTQSQDLPLISRDASGNLHVTTEPGATLFVNGVAVNMAGLKADVEDRFARLECLIRGLRDAGGENEAIFLAAVEEVDTSGATDWVAFTIAKATYLAVANQRDDVTYNIKSRIYRYSAELSRFELVQEVDTSGARDLEAFTLDGATYLAVANHRDDDTYNIKSRIYRYSAELSRFELMQEVDTSGAHNWAAFTLNGVTYLAMANSRNGQTYNLKSRIYRHSAMLGYFELMQEVDTSGATDWEAFTLDGVGYLAVANSRDGSNYNIKSRIYRYSSDSDRFEVEQEVDTSGAMDWKAFTMCGATYLAVANRHNGKSREIKSRIYRHSAILGRFELVQEINTIGAHGLEAFTLDDGATYLAVANHHDDGSTFNLRSHIYRYSATSGLFELLQEVNTSGAKNWKAFTLGGVTHLAVANHDDGSTYNLKSRIYRIGAPS